MGCLTNQRTLLRKPEKLCEKSFYFVVANQLKGNIVTSSSKDRIDTKFFKPSQAENNKTRKCSKNIFIVVFCNKRVEQSIDRNLKSKGSIPHFRGKRQLQENVRVITYRLTPAVGNNVLNYKKTLHSVIAYDERLFSSTLHLIQIPL